MSSKNSGNSALLQAFYLSKQFRSIKAETRDLRIHPILGGISSTRWKAYKRFKARNSRLFINIKQKTAYKRAIQLTGLETEKIIPRAPDEANIQYLKSRNGRLKKKGILSGDHRRNTLKGSLDKDVLIGGGGKDRIIGRGGDDLLSGGQGPDLFIFRPDQRSTTKATDMITDFKGNKGDRIRIHGAKEFLGYKAFTGQPGEVNFIVWMAAKEMPDETKIGGPYGIYQGAHLNIDRDGDGMADQVIDLPGQGWIEKNWILTD